MKDLFDNALNNMILSASGWRTVFAVSGQEEDKGTDISDEKRALAILAATAFSQYIRTKIQGTCTVVVGTDSRPTGNAIANAMIKALIANDICIKFTGIIAAPEIMAYARNYDGFVYISASHNPVGHNGLKFGLADGGVIPGDEARILIDSFKKLCAGEDPEQDAQNIINRCPEDILQAVYAGQEECKNASFSAYHDFTVRVVSGETESEKQQVFFKTIQNAIKEQSLSILCDMNGSARCLSIDKQFLSDQGINFISFNDIAGNIVHAIIPEGENLQYCAKEMEALHNSGKTDVLLAYMPDCDGDRGNIVYWNTHTQRAEILQAQEVFALCVLSELAYSVYRAKQNNQSDNLKLAVAVNGPTSMRIDDIAKVFDAKVCRAEVGEANVVNRARELRNEGYSVPILGEGSNGGNITHPAAVRDPMNTLFALIKLLTLKSNGDTPGLFELWCKKSGQPEKYNQNFSFADISETLPHYTSTGGSEKRGLLHIKSKNHITLKANLQKLFVAAWEEKKDSLLSAYGIVSWDALATVGTEEKSCTEDFTLSMSGGLKIRFKTQEGISASVWMRASGTEPVFRIMCDAKGKNTETEKELLDWVTKLLEKADTM